MSIELAGCPGAETDQPAPDRSAEPVAPGQFELRLNSGVELDTD